MKTYLQNHFDWCKIMQYTLSQIIIGLFFTGICFAEKSSEEKAQVIVTGKVTDRTGQPLIGVSIKVKGSTVGASTDANGQFSMTLPDGNSTLVFTYIGYVTQEISVNNRTTINVSLQEDTASLDEVVVVGYGTQKKANLTGAVSTVSSKVLESRPITNLGQGLQGTVSNLNITQGNGSLGQGSTFNIRGNTSINGGSPLMSLSGGKSLAFRRRL